MAIKLHPSFAVHPGAWLREEIVDPHGLTVKRASEMLGVAGPTLSNFLNGKAGLSADMAIRFEKCFGVSADTLMRMQSAHEMAIAREHQDDLVVEPLPELAAA